MEKGTVKTEKHIALCMGMFPKTSEPFAKKMVENLKDKNIQGAEVQQALDPGYVRVVINAKDKVEADQINEAAKKAGFSGFVFEY